MHKLVKLILILFAINFAVFAISDAFHVDDFLLYLFLLPVSITVSFILFIIAVIKNIRNSYVAKDAVQRKASRKKGLVIFGCVVLLFLVGFIALVFACGYKIPGRDRHKNWPHFPGSSSEAMVIKADPNLHIYQIKPIANTPFYTVYFTTDSLHLDNGNVNNTRYFGIMDNKGRFRVKYENSTLQFWDGNRIIVKKDIYGDDAKLPEPCDVYDLQTLTKTEEVINPVPLPATKAEYNEAAGTEQGQTRFKEKYHNDFFDNLSGVPSIVYSDYYSDNDYRGYTLYKDTTGKLYKTASYDDSLLLETLSPQVTGYTPVKDSTANKNTAPNIKRAGESVITYNNANGGVYSSSGIFYEFHQTWLLYYTAFVGSNTTCFKLEGSDKDCPYTNFYQLNEASKDMDTLLFVAENKVYRLYKK
jgi:hypothetical protein